ncbi:alanine racemase [Clostridiaceae bacterium HSG29]|nr:alanine racemase [Clostridiaceae bacterium HSG29]
MVYKGVDLLRDTFVEINLDSLKDNIKNIKERVGENVSIAAVVKSDGYGHGAVEIGKILIENGASHLAVATLTEALELRNVYENIKIFIMGYTPDSHLRIAAEKNIDMTIFSIHQARLLNEIGEILDKKPVVHIKYDTGFNRLGYKDCNESIVEISEIVKLDNLNVEGIFSHFALAGNESNHKQFNDFIKAVEAIEATGFIFKYKHICDSIAAIDYPEFNLDMVRTGAILYGMKSFRFRDIDLKSVMSFKTKIYHVKTLKIGEGVSYNFKWKAKRDSVIATIPVGYSDGLPRNMADVGMVTIKGKRAPLVGVICMDQCMVDITDLKDAQVGDEVIIFDDGTGNSLTVGEFSKLGNTNKNEILTRITRRTPRVYIKNNKIHKIVDYLIGDSLYEY